MRWIILALSLGASTMSLMHGILIILGIFNPPEVAAWSAIIPPTVLKSLPIVSACIALIGGIVAFSGSKAGAFFLLVATVLCAFAPRDIWIYGGLYLLAMILCIFLKKRQYNQDYYDYDFEDFESLDNGSDDNYGNYNNNYNNRDDYGYNEARGGDNYNYRSERGGRDLNLNNNLNNNNYEGESRGVILSNKDINMQDNNDLEFAKGREAEAEGESERSRGRDKFENIDIPESVLPRRRAFKTCPKCGENVSPEASICPTCGEPLHVPEYAKPGSEAGNSSGAKHGIINIDIKNDNIKQELKTESRDDDMEAVVRMEPTAAHKVFVKPRHEEDDIPRRPVDFEGTRRTSLDINPDKSYQEFGQYARRRKRGSSKSFGRRVLSFIVLFAAVGGALWFLLGLRKLPKDELPPSIRDVSNNTRQEREESQDVDDILVQPVGPAVSTTPDNSANNNINNNISLPAFTPDRNPSRAIITRPSVNLREDHNTTSRSLTKLSANTQAELLDRWSGSGTGKTPGPWYKIRTGNREGWVYGDYVQQRGGALPSGYSSALLKSFGSSKADLNASFGSPRTSNNTTMEWSGVTATFRNNNLVRLRLNPGSQYELKNGLKPGMSRDELLNIMGYPSSISQRNYIYSEAGKTGISVEIRNNNINSITVNDVR